MLEPLSPSFHIVAAPAPAALPPELELEVEAVWRAAVEASGRRLFNGVLFSLIEHTPERAVAEPTEYRRYTALRLQPQLAARGLRLRPMGVTGLTRCRDGVVMGRRADRLELGGLWEPAPAGTLDRPDPAALFLDELREELGVDAHEVTLNRPAFLYEDASGVIDVIHAIELDLDGPALLARHHERGSDEYPEIDVIPWDTFLASGERTDFTELARALVSGLRASPR